MWTTGSIGITAGISALVLVLARIKSVSADEVLGVLIVFGYTGHVASTAWLARFPEVRSMIRHRPVRLLVTPAALIVGACVAVSLLPSSSRAWLLLGFFVWQFAHFQKQNLGLAAMSARARGAPGLSRVERRALLLAGVSGIAALVAHPSLLDLHPGYRLVWLFFLAGALWIGSVLTGLMAMTRRPRVDQPPALSLCYASGLLFFGPVFVFRSPYEAVAPLVIAHGVQYLWLLGTMAADRRSSSERPGPLGPRTGSLVVFGCLVLAGGLILSLLSGLHAARSDNVRLLYALYLGLVMTHFVMDATLWRGRDEWSRHFLATRVPFLADPAGRTWAAHSTDESPVAATTSSYRLPSHLHRTPTSGRLG
jgi:hypothetical protein